MNIDKLKQVIQKANPKKIWEFPHIGEKTRQPIRLADVLMALKKKAILIDSGGIFYEMNDDVQLEKAIGYWSFKDNNLDNQSEATKQFLIDILVK